MGGGGRSSLAPRPNMSDMNTEVLEGQRVGLVWLGGGAIKPRASHCSSPRLFSQKAKESKHKLVVYFK